MNPLKTILVLLPALILFSSCNTEKKKLVGWWAIDSITIKGENRKIDLSVNSFTFEDNGDCRLPMLEFKGIESGQWRIEKDEDDRYLIIESKNNPLVGRYRLIYFKDPKKKLYRMSLQSDSIEMVCSKAFQNYKE